MIVGLVFFNPSNSHKFQLVNETDCDHDDVLIFDKDSKILNFQCRYFRHNLIQQYLLAAKKVVYLFVGVKQTYKSDTEI